LHKIDFWVNQIYGNNEGAADGNGKSGLMFLFIVGMQVNLVIKIFSNR
jgi:hypothetical protein